jgi:hypothetical protein
MSGHGQLQVHQRLDMRAVEVKDALANIKQAKSRDDPDDAEDSLSAVTRPAASFLSRSVKRQGKSASGSFRSTIVLDAGATHCTP